ncbi:hypothetical protein B0H19DRAFT_1067449 [Mycena capillaripes]|nr:hypothetical protein B0H19DRAFT_1067449 [Mycena capillaripes]
MRALWLVLLLLMVFVCPDPCLEVFDTEVGLSLHQNSCLHVNAHDENMDRALTARRERKRLEKEQKAAAAAAAAALQPDPSQDFFGPAPEEDIEMPYQEPEPPVQEEEPPAVSSTGRPVRAKRLTWKLLQQLPPPPIEFEEPPPSEPDVEPPEPPASEHSWQSIKTVKNSFGISIQRTCSTIGYT